VKILLIGNNFFNYTSALYQAFSESNNEAALCILKDNWIATPAGQVFRKVNDMGYLLRGKKDIVGIHSNAVICEDNRKVLEMYDWFKPDAVVSFAGYTLNRSSLKHMKRCPKIFWVYDAYERLSDKVKQALPYYDRICTFEKDDIRHYEQLGIKACFLPLCADDSVYYPKAKEKDIDVSFAGALTKERLALFRKIRSRMPGIKMNIYGTYAGRYNIAGRISRNMHAEQGVFMNRGLSPDAVNDLYARSKICINLHRAQSRYGANIRLYELLAAGAFQITDSNPYIEDNFKGCLETFHNSSELLQLLEYYLGREEERKIISDSGYQKAMKSELFIHRAGTLLKMLHEMSIG